jgi:transposase
MDLRVLADLDAGGKTRAVAAKYTVSGSWVRRLAQTRRDTGRVAPAAQRHGPASAWGADADRPRQAVAESPDATSAEHRQRLGLGYGRTTLSRAVRALGLVRKESPSGRPSRTART